MHLQIYVFADDPLHLSVFSSGSNYLQNLLCGTFGNQAEATTIPT